LLSSNKSIDCLCAEEEEEQQLQKKRHPDATTGCTMSRRRYIGSNQIKRLKVILNRRLPKSPGIRYAFRLDGIQSLISFIYSRKIKRHNTILILGNTYCYFDTVKTCHGEQAVDL
jgi:hypothetical protein